MARYIRLLRLTEEGVKNVERLGDMVGEARKILEANGGKVVDSYSTLGRYDLVAIVEAPDDATMMRISALIAHMGYAHAETLPAVPTPDFAKSVAAERKPSRSRARGGAAPTAATPEKPAPAKRKPSRPRAAASPTGRSRTRKPTPPPQAEESAETEEEGHTVDETED